MPYENWEKLSEHGKHIARLVKAPKGEVVLGAGFVSSNGAEREAFKEAQLAQLVRAPAPQLSSCGWCLRRTPPPPCGPGGSVLEKNAAERLCGLWRRAGA